MTPPAHLGALRLCLLTALAGCDAFVVGGSEMDADGDGLMRWEDCDDGNTDINGPVTWYYDDDGDGYVDENNPSQACPDAPPTAQGWVLASTVWPGDVDCDDAAADVHPGALETCDGVDNNCDGLVDVADPSVASDELSVWYPDADGDGFGQGELGDGQAHCAPPDGPFVQVHGDCDDSDDAVHPDAQEVCDDQDIDEDCSGGANDLDPGVSDDSRSDWYLDLDQDGFGAGDAIRLCDAPAGTTDQDGDCDDTNPDIHPDAVEVCDDLGKDEDCDGDVNDADADQDLSTAPLWYVDRDEDGYGDQYHEGKSSCADPSSPATLYSTENTDCNDDPATGAFVNPGALEVCDDLDTDEDCSGAADDEDPGTDSGLMLLWYDDVDGDGYGDDQALGQLACDDPTLDGGVWQVLDHTDCNDDPLTGADIHPAADEVCDSADTDENCNGVADDADSTTLASSKTDYYIDADDDGYGDEDATALSQCEDPSVAGGDHYTVDFTDCDDTDELVHPGKTEVCDELDTDEDCSGDADDDDPGVDSSTFTVFYDDFDEDGFGSDSDSGTAQCDAPTTATVSIDNTDCDDSDDQINPDADEICDAADTDEDCNGMADDYDPGVTGTFVAYYPDADADGFGDETDPGTEYCDDPSVLGRAFTTDNQDCDDTDGGVHPASVEVCDTGGLVDEDCDGLFDDQDPSLETSTGTEYYEDGDKDGYGDAEGTAVLACADPSTATILYEPSNTDCDDNDALINPGATEICDASHEVDEDCNGSVDDNDRFTDTTSMTDYYPDADADSYGDDSATATRQCRAPAGYVEDNQDCDDNRSSIHPLATEVCDRNDRDEDCNGQADDADTGVDVSTYDTWYADSDGDGYGDPAVSQDACDQPSGYVDNDEDCQDGDSSISPATVWYADADGDGYGHLTFTQTVCVQPSSYVSTGTDCDDLDDEIYPSAPERCNGEDDNCDGSVTVDDSGDAEADSDGDMYVACELDEDGWTGSGVVLGGDDCDDTSAVGADVYPGAPDQCDDTVDSDCDGLYHCGVSGLDYVVGEDDGDRFARSPLLADLDGDGYGELVLGSRNSDGPSNTGSENGHLVVLPGGSSASYGSGYSSTGGWSVWYGSGSYDYCAQKSAYLGDQSGDGVGDHWIATGCYRADSSTHSNSGGVYILEGTLTGTKDLETDAAVVVYGGYSSDYLGVWMEGPADLDNDGVDDLLVGAPYANVGGSYDVGTTYVLYGPLSSTSSGGSVNSLGNMARIDGSSKYDYLGEAMSASDVTGDGVVDLLVTARGYDRSSGSSTYSLAGRVYLVEGPITAGAVLDAETAADATLTGPNAYDQVGYRMVGAGDLNNDGCGDIATGINGHDTPGSSAGGVGVFYGCQDTVSPYLGFTDALVTDAPLFLEGAEAGDRAGLSVLGPGDLNGDSIDDLVVGAPYADAPDGTSTGAVYILLGGGISSGTASLSTLDGYIYGENAGDDLGYYLGGGNRNNDGMMDLLLPAALYDTATASDVGIYYLLDGSTGIGQ